MNKKIISAIIIPMTMITASYGVTLCKKSNTAVAVLNKLVGGSVQSASGHRWVVNMADESVTTVVKGKSLCSGTSGDFATVNTGVADTADTGHHCYCKLMAPATSYWVNATGSNPYASDNDCESGCVGLCANYMAGTYSWGTGENEHCKSAPTMNDVGSDPCITLRDAVYEAIW